MRPVAGPLPNGPNQGNGADSPLKSALVAGFKLTDEDRGDLVAFLESLTDREFLADRRFSDPWPTHPAPRLP